MHRIHFRLAVLVAFDAGEGLAARRVDVTDLALIPFVQMGAGVDGEELGVVVAKLSFLARRMALVAIHRIESIPWNSLMHGIHLRLTVLVTLDAGECFAVGGIGVTGLALIPLVLMRAREDGEVLGVVLAKFAFLTGWVALVAVERVEAVAGDTLMHRVHLRLAVLVAFDAGKNFAVGGIGVAGLA
ncbi:hypothetical protein D6833_05630, partial [Candidatus Parcubacteria bacterium]